MRMVPEFRFDERQSARKKGLIAESQSKASLVDKVMAELADEPCYSLGTFVDALVDATEELKLHTRAINGKVLAVERNDVLSKWDVTINVDSNNEEKSATIVVKDVDAVIFATGGQPVTPKLSNNDIKVEDMDLFVNPDHVRDTFHNHPNLKDARWCVAGGSHSAILIVKNLVEMGAQDIVNIYRSDLRYQHRTEQGWMKYQGIGLKGPVGVWAKQHLPHPSVQRIR